MSHTEDTSQWTAETVTHLFVTACPPEVCLSETWHPVHQRLLCTGVSSLAHVVGAQTALTLQPELRVPVSSSFIGLWVCLCGGSNSLQALLSRDTGVFVLLPLVKFRGNSWTCWTQAQGEGGQVREFQKSGFS